MSFLKQAVIRKFSEPDSPSAFSPERIQDAKSWARYRTEGPWRKKKDKAVRGAREALWTAKGLRAARAGKAPQAAHQATIEIKHIRGERTGKALRGARGAALSAAGRKAPIAKKATLDRTERRRQLASKTESLAGILNELRGLGVRTLAGSAAGGLGGAALGGALRKTKIKPVGPPKGVVGPISFKTVKKLSPLRILAGGILGTLLGGGVAGVSGLGPGNLPRTHGRGTAEWVKRLMTESKA